MAFLETDRLAIDPMEVDDAENHQDIIHSDGMRSYGGLKKPGSLHDIEEYIKETDTLLLAIRKDGEMVGEIGIHQDSEISRTEELFIYIKDGHQGNGYGTEALERVIPYCFDELNLHKLTARTFAHNEAMQHVLKKLGFQQEGRFRDEFHKQGEYRDILRYGLLRDDF